MRSGRDRGEIVRARTRSCETGTGAGLTGVKVAASDADGPPPELLIPSLWAEGMSKEDFKAALVHSFHCRTPSCPVPDCASITSKLQRLHQHVSTCDLDNCLLCRMWTHLKYYRDSADPGGGGGGRGVRGGARIHRT